ncbi:CHAT domain-containing protein [Mycena galopus ATCC 62051]|nr:CHAT domain-containing protein [Mycena galopus ATCC 62051]
MQIFAQLIVNNHIILQTVPLHSEPSQTSWGLEPECTISENAPTFMIAVMRHSKTCGTRLLGSVGIAREKLAANFSSSTSATDRENRTDNTPSQITFVGEEFGTLAHRLLRMKMNNDHRQSDQLQLWVIHENILFLPQTDHRGLLLGSLGDIGLKHRSALPGMEYLNQSVCAYEDAMRDSPRKATYLEGLALALHYRFQEHGSPDDIHKAVSLNRQALALDLSDDTHRAILGENLAACLLLRFDRFSEIDDINECISRLEDTVHLTPDSDNPAKRISNLGVALRHRFEKIGNLTDINECISKQRDAVQRIPDANLDKSVWLTNLGDSLRSRFGRLGDLSDLSECITHQQSAVQLTPGGHPDLPSRLTSLGNSLLRRYEQCGELSDLEEAVSAHEAAFCLIPADHLEKPRMLNNLALSLLHRCQRFGDHKDVNECIAQLEDAVWLTHDDLDKANKLNILGNFLLYRFMQLGDLGDLDECISKQQDAVKLTTDPVKLYNLGISLRYRFERFSDLADLNECILKQRNALSLTPPSHPQRPAALNGLGDSLRHRFERIGDLSDLNESISMHEDAVHLTSNKHLHRPIILTSLGSALLCRFRKLGNVNDINNSISHERNAVCLTPPNHPDLPAKLNNLGNALIARFEQFGNLADLQEAIHQYTAAACSTTGPAHLRLHTAELWVYFTLMAQYFASEPQIPSLPTTFDVAQIFTTFSEWAHHPWLIKGFQVALDLLPEVAWLGLSIQDRHHQILRAGLLVRNAASASISAGQPERGVEWLEQGRSIIWSQFLNLRTPLDALQQKLPQLAQELIALSAQLDGATTRINDMQLIDSGVNQSPRSIAHQAHENALKRSLLLEKIRQLPEPEFQQFLLPKTISQLSPTARSGPVVFLNVSQISCDCLILLKGLTEEVMHVSLPQFGPEDAKCLAESFRDIVPSGGRGDLQRLQVRRDGSFPDVEEEFARILLELWVRLVKPVLDALAITNPTTDNLLRIWWCPTGQLSSLPIHAAGVYGADVAFGSKLSDFVISSYIPSLAPLIQEFTPVPRSEGEFQLLAIAQPSAVGQSYIPGTRDEIAQIEKCSAGNVPVCTLVDEDTTIQKVQEQMIKSRWVHFACHGVQDRTSPTKSALLLAGRSQLTLEEIIKLSIPHAEFAFLSACQTATGDTELPDESVHLAAGMLLAGYRGVIASLWSIMDDDAPQVAADVYGHLFKASQPDATQAAEALHLAIGNLRAHAGERSFSRWVPFIHVGV